ncbi:hypothetical protein [Microbacterium jiangjiandongii]|uniref:hypothetical protein n=1 Tax=Microbacterium jiangjiandongii TaxID=3049071 RepID=UPI00214C5D7F|nr:hypothetical protein [Microbacterium sp. zg.Y843]MCR2815304.1 hypothetical protein [Microbacterium sp. zg.Y843]
MVRFTVGGRSVTAGPHASAVACGEGESLLRREESLLTADIERVPGAVDADDHRGGLAERLVEHRTGQCRATVLEVGDAQEAPERVTRADGIRHGHEPHTGLTRPEDVLRGCQGGRSAAAMIDSTHANISSSKSMRA